MADKIKFEKALEGLEKIVNELESGEVALETALKKYEEGIKLARICQGQLAEAEKKIEILSKRPDGSFDSEDFEIGGSEEEPEKKKAGSSKKKTKTEDEDKDFLL